MSPSPEDWLPGGVGHQALMRFAKRAAPLVAPLTDECEIKRVLREGLVEVLKELGLDCEHEEGARRRLDQAVRDALAHLDRLSEPRGR